jgi:dTDP-4-dehydrorhamnose reductase
VRFLVIGASGFVGRHILSHVKSLGYTAIGTQRQSKYCGLVPFDLLHHRIRDRIDTSFFKTDEPIFGVICAVIRQIDRCFRERKLTRIVNVDNTIRLIQDLKVLGVKPIFLSSSFVYDGSTGYYSEKHPVCPINEYGRQKAEVEDFIKNNVTDALVLRLDKIVGSDPLEEHLFSEWYQLIRRNQPIICIEGQIFSPTYVKDVAKAVVLACQKVLSGLYHVANSEFFTREELARQFVLTLNKKCKVICKLQQEFNFLDQRPLKSYLDSTKFKKATGMRFTSMREVFRLFMRGIKTESENNLIRKTSQGANTRMKLIRAHNIEEV